MLSEKNYHLAPTYSIKAQVPEQRLHEDLSQVGVRMARCSAVGAVRGSCKARARRQYLRAISRRAVTQERGHMGVVLETGQDNVELHPLGHRVTHAFQRT